jgi:hypothetical protein
MDTETVLGVFFLDDTTPSDCDLTQNIFQVNEDPDDPVINGDFGPVDYIKFNGSTEIEINPAINPSVTGHAWRNPGSPGNNRYMVVTCLYGDGKVAFVPDSSPTSDGTGDPNDTSYGNTFSHPDYDNDRLFLNVSTWLAEGASPHPTATPQIPTATPTPDALNGVDLQLNKTIYSEGDFFQLDYRCGNQEESGYVDLYIALDVSGAYWFYPQWTQELSSELLYLQTGSVTNNKVLSFVWPEVDVSVMGLKFWGAALTPDSQLLGTYDMIEWGYE